MSRATAAPGAGAVAGPATGHALDLLAPDAPVAVASERILRTPALSAFLGGRPVVRLSAGGEVGAVAGWGGRRSGLRAQRAAAQRGVAALRLEDGFIRSVGLGKAGAAAVSLVVDDVGIYYDARSPSRLETLLASHGWESEALRAEAAAACSRWADARLSKYNVGRDTLPSARAGRRWIVLVDQVAGDASIAGGLADPATFERMLATALATWPAARLAVRTHPDVAAGRGRGHLLAAARRKGLTILDEDVSPHAVLDIADAVWTVSSALGLEALLRGVPVTTFAMPFYAGWGLTEDRAEGADARRARARRGRSRTPIELFAAAFLMYARYADPVTRRPLDIMGAMDRLEDWRRRDRAAAGTRTVAFGMSRWKQPSVRTLLGGSAAPVAFAGAARAGAVARWRGKADRAAVWGMTDRPGFVEACRAAGLAVVRVEDGFVRSVGLGSDLLPPGSLVADDLGIYYDAGRPSRLEVLLQEGAMPPDLLERARLLRERLVRERLTKYNLGPSSSVSEMMTRSAGRRRLLVCEQVPNDAALRLGSGRIATNTALLEAVRAEAPDAFIVYKEHPDLVAGNRPGRQPTAVLGRSADLVVSDGDIGGLLERVDAVHVISSLAGFEALLRGVPVVTWGRPFYAGWGLTQDHEAFPRRTRAASLDALVAATLILYPRYIDPISGVPCSVEDLLASVAEQLLRPPAPPRRGLARQVERLMRWVRG